MALKIKKGDTVRVIAGKDKDRDGKVLAVDVKKNRVVVEGVNKVSRHMKPNAQNQNGGIVEKEAPIHASNVMFLENGTPVRLGFKVEGDKKVRFSKKTGKVVD